MDNAVIAKRATETATTIEKIKLSIASAQIVGLGKVDETDLKKELTNYFGAEGTGYTIEGNSTDGWEVNVTRDAVAYLINVNGSLDTIDNSNSLILGLVDDLGTRSTIYLYNNTSNITNGSITITLPDSTTQTITAIADTSNITSSDNYYAYTVSKNGIYTFTATDGTTETETKINVKNIEKFTKVDSMGLSYVNSENKAYDYNGAAVPKGYYVDTKSSVDTGLVVTDSIDSEGYSTGNEWVWVPVNSTVGNDDYYGTETTATALAGATSVTYTKYSKLYSFMDKTREAYGTFYPYGTSTGTLSRPSTTLTSEYPGWREIAILQGTSYGEIVKYNLINKRGTETKFENVTDVATQYINDYNNMVESVDKYRGFYIGRYEITADGEMPGDSLVNKNWYEFYNECMTLGKTNTESGMIYGALWDATMQWLAKSNYSVGYTGEKSSGYGNYASEVVTVKQDEIVVTVKPMGEYHSEYGGYYTEGRVLRTGQTSYTRSNNIYDLSGNCSDWTQEAAGACDRVYRGGNYGSSGYTYSASRSFSYPTYSDDYNSSRPHFYIK